MSQPIISVVVSTYNRVKKLERAINSILNQTFKDYEIIIVDDCSTDKTSRYCSKLVKKHDNIRYIVLPTNFGRHGKPKNVGIKESAGKYIAFLDDDNEYTMDHLQALYNEMKQKPWDVVYGDRWVVDEMHPKKMVKGISSDFNPAKLRSQNYIDTSDVLILKDALLQVGGWDEELKKFADWNLFVRLAKSGKNFLHVPKLLSKYYIHDDMNQKRNPSSVHPQTGLPLPTFNPENVLLWANQSTFGPEKPMRVAIFTLTKDRLEYTKKTLDSLVQCAGYSYDHFIVDNGSTDGTLRWLEDNREKYNIKQIIKNPVNVGISKGSNQALNAIGKSYDVIMKLDNDCEIQTENLILDIVDIFRRNARMIISPAIEGLIDNAGGPPRIQSGYMGEHLLGFVRHLGGIACAAPAEIYYHFRWNEEDFLHGMQDSVFSQFAYNNGFALAYLENQRAMHIDSTYGQKEKFPEYFKLRRDEKTTKYSKQ